MPELTQEHKDALAKGRQQSHSVRRYLEALEMGAKPKNGTDPQAKRDELESRLARIAEDIETTSNPVTRVKLIQDRLEVERELSAVTEVAEMPDIEALEEEFKAVVPEYAERKGITYRAFREVGVPAKVLREAGLSS